MNLDPIALAQAGPVALLIAIIFAMVIAFVKGIVVPGWLYRNSEAKLEKAETLMTALTVTADKTADALKEATAALTVLSKGRPRA